MIQKCDQNKQIKKTQVEKNESPDTKIKKFNTWYLQRGTERPSFRVKFALSLQCYTRNEMGFPWILHSLSWNCCFQWNLWSIKVLLLLVSIHVKTLCLVSFPLPSVLCSIGNWYLHSLVCFDSSTTWGVIACSGVHSNSHAPSFLLA